MNISIFKNSLFTLVLLAVCSLSISAQTAQSFTDMDNGMTTPNVVLGPQINEFGNCTFYSDLAEFQAACPGLPIEGFENSQTPPNDVDSCPNPVNSASANCFDVGKVIPGFSLTATGDGGKMAVLTTGFLSITSDVVGADRFMDHLEISFDANDVTAVTFDLLIGFGTGDVQIDIYDLSNTLVGTSVANNVGLTPQFIGMSTTAPISKIVISSNDLGELIDNLSFGACLVIPTMGQWALIILALLLSSIGLVFLYGKSRNAVQA